MNVFRGASEACDQNVLMYIAGTNERSNKEMRHLYINYWVNNTKTSETG